MELAGLEVALGDRVSGESEYEGLQRHYGVHYIVDVKKLVHISYAFIRNFSVIIKLTLV